MPAEPCLSLGSGRGGGSLDSGFSRLLYLILLPPRPHPQNLLPAHFRNPGTFLHSPRHRSHPLAAPRISRTQWLPSLPRCRFTIRVSLSLSRYARVACLLPTHPAGPIISWSTYRAKILRALSFGVVRCLAVSSRLWSRPGACICVGLGVREGQLGGCRGEGGVKGVGVG